MDKILQTVVNNLLVTNNIDLQGDIRCRVLLTSPLESFTIGHTIVVSRGLLDVLPDEASLAMVLAHELSHIVLGHQFDTKLAFNDRMFFPDEESFQRLDFKRSAGGRRSRRHQGSGAAEELSLQRQTGNRRAISEGLAGTCARPAKLDSPASGQRFLARGQECPDVGAAGFRAATGPKRTDQIAALPLGGRIKLDPWSDQVELAKAKPVAADFGAGKDAVRDHAILPLPHEISRLRAARRSRSPLPPRSSGARVASRNHTLRGKSC